MDAALRAIGLSGVRSHQLGGHKVHVKAYIKASRIHGHGRQASAAPLDCSCPVAPAMPAQHAAGSLLTLTTRCPALYLLLQHNQGTVAGVVAAFNKQQEEDAAARRRYKELLNRQIVLLMVWERVCRSKQIWSLVVDTI